MKKIFKQEESTDILEIVGLIRNIITLKIWLKKK